MAIINCSECGTEVSSNAEKCPKCSNPISGRQPQQAAPAQAPQKKKMGLLKGCCLAFAGLMVLSVIASIVQDANMTPEEKKARAEQRAQAKAEREKAAAERAAAKAEASKPAGVGEPVSTRYFEVTVNRAYTTPAIGDEFTGENAGQGNTFLVMNITIKNTDSEARIFNDGSLFVTHQGKELEFDASESVMADGWIVFENLNPLTSVTGNIAFKVPDPLPQPVYWQPGRSEKRILLGE